MISLVLTQDKLKSMLKY